MPLNILHEISKMKINTFLPLSNNDDIILWHIFANTLEDNFIIASSTAMNIKGMQTSFLGNMKIFALSKMTRQLLCNLLRKAGIWYLKGANCWDMEFISYNDGKTYVIRNK